MGLFDNLNFSKLKTGLTKTRNRLVNSINETLTGKLIIDEETIDQAIRTLAEVIRQEM